METSSSGIARAIPTLNRGDDHLDAKEDPRAKESQRKIEGRGMPGAEKRTSRISPTIMAAMLVVASPRCAGRDY
jgi:hypothetical protein